MPGVVQSTRATDILEYPQEWLPHLNVTRLKETGDWMGKLISMETRNELVKVLGMRYREGNMLEKGKILDEFTKVSGYHCIHIIRLHATKKEGKLQPPNCQIYNVFY